MRNPEYRTVGRLLILIPLLLSALSICGWISGHLSLSSFYPGWKAMAPFTSAVLFLLSLSFFLSQLFPEKKIIPVLSGGIALSLILSVFLERCNLFPAGFELSFVPDISRGFLSSVNTGTVSPLTIVFLTILSIVTFLQPFMGNKFSTVSGFTGIFTLAAGLVDIMGYVIENRILQGIVSFPTGVSFIFVGCGFLLRANPLSFPAVLFISEKTSAVILRRIIPLIIIILFIQSFILKLFKDSDSMFSLAVFTAFFIAVTVIVSARVSFSMGRTIDRLIDQRETARLYYRESENKYETLVESLQEGIAVLDENGIIKYANPRTSELFDIKDDLTGKGLLDYISFSGGEYCDDFNKAILEGKIIRSECVINNQNGKKIFALITVVPFGKSNEFNGAIAGIVDISDKKKAEEDLKVSLENREILLRELYHRTKNNMQVICSLIRLRMKDIPDEKSRQHFKDLDNRILSMSLVHQKLYESKNLSVINISDYTCDLAGRLVRNCCSAAVQIRLELNIEKVMLPIEIANPFGLLITELISNSCKHAFIRDSGVISISMVKENNHGILKYHDDGQGLPSDFELEKTSTFGFRIIKSLVENQLNGILELKKDSGFSLEIVFPLEVDDHLWAGIGN